MNKWAILILVLVLLLAGCARDQVNTKLPPLVYIDSISANEIYTGDKITFAGHGVSSFGEIVAYNWRSSINGDLSTQATFETNDLSAGRHTIWFKAQDNYGNWSNEIGTNVNVLIAGAPTKMLIKNFTASPPAIRVGELTNLTWDISGSGWVKIDPDIGDVALSGSRSVRPLRDTVYTLVATNDQGVVNATTQVTVSTIPIHTLITYSVAGEDGTVRKDRVVLDEVLVGINDAQIQMQGFLSFDVSTLPPDANIKSVELDMTSTIVYGSPFPNQGSLLFYNQSFGSSLRGNDYMINVPAGYLYSWSSNTVQTMVPPKPFTSKDLANAVQKAVEERNSRFQIRVQFEKYFYYARTDYSYTSGAQKLYPQNAGNYMDVGSGKPKLTVFYTLPD